jgi:hypothetical protein
MGGRLMLLLVKKLDAESETALGRHRGGARPLTHAHRPLGPVYTRAGDEGDVVRADTRSRRPSRSSTPLGAAEKLLAESEMAPGRHRGGARPLTHAHRPRGPEAALGPAATSFLGAAAAARRPPPSRRSPRPHAARGLRCRDAAGGVSRRRLCGVRRRGRSPAAINQSPVALPAVTRASVEYIGPRRAAMLGPPPRAARRQSLRSRRRLSAASLRRAAPW